MTRTKTSLIRARCLTTGGLGVHFSSPIKRRDKKKSSTIIHVPGHRYKRQTLLHEIEALMRQSSPSPVPQDFNSPDDTPLPMDTGNDISHVHIQETFDCDQDVSPGSQDAVKRRIHPDEEAYSLYDRWISLLPSLVDTLLSYDKTSMGSVFPPATNIIYSCSDLTCSRKATQITSLYFDRMCLSYLCDINDLLALRRF
jgi:hypothetical protein